MRAFTVLSFDDVIAGTGTTWYTSASGDDQLGTADGLGLHAVTTAVSGTSPTLRCVVETSANGKDWYNAVPFVPQISDVSISSGGSYAGNLPQFTPTLQRYVRIAISLGGTSPACRLKLYVTGEVNE